VPREDSGVGLRGWKVGIRIRYMKTGYISGGGRGGGEGGYSLGYPGNDGWVPEKVHRNFPLKT